MASAAAEKQRLRDWLRDSVGEGATAFADAIIVSFEAAGYAPDEWVQTLASMGASAAPMLFPVSPRSELGLCTRVKALSNAALIAKTDALKTQG